MEDISSEVIGSEPDVVRLGFLSSEDDWYTDSPLVGALGYFEAH